MSAGNLKSILADLDSEFYTAWDRMKSLRLRDSIRTGWGGELKLAWRSFGKVPVDVVLAGTAEPIEVLLTEDGLYADTRSWHEGKTTGESIYVERWDAEHGRYWHGYVDPTTRKVVQTG